MTLTREEILAMEPGQDLDRLISIHVMGFEIRKEYLADQSYHEYYYREGYKYENVNYPNEWQPSRFIDAAWEVVESIMNRNLDVRIYCVSMKINKLFDCVIYEGDNSKVVVVMQSTAPESICKAALLSVLKL